MGTAEFWRVGDSLTSTQLLSGRKATAASPRRCLVGLFHFTVFLPLVSPTSRSHSTVATGIQDLFQASSRRQEGGQPGRRGCCAHHPPPGPQPLPAHRPHRFLVTVPPSVVKIASSWKEFQNEIYVPLQLPKWLQLWQLNPLMC